MSLKMLSRIFAAALIALSGASAALAQTYPTTTPVYIPSAVELPTTCTAACDVTFTVSGVSTVSLQLVGAPSAITASVQGTNQAPSVASPTWTALNMIPINGGSAVTSTSAVGFWTINTTGLTKIRAHITAITGSVAVNLTGSSGGTVTFSSNSVVLADVEANIAPGTAPAKQAVVGAVYNATPPTFTDGQTGALQLDSDGSLAVTVREFGTTQDPCQSPAVQKSSVAVAISTATTTQLVALNGTKKVYVCGFSATTGAAGALTFEYGTGASCGTGTTTLTGAMVMGTTGSITLGNSGGTLMSTAAGNAFCALTATGAALQGVLTYVQQ